MGYMHIGNLYRDDRIFRFDECYAMEKIHGTSAHIKFNRKNVGDELSFFSNGESHKKFVALFDAEKLKATFDMLGGQEIIVYGEAYGGKQQGMSATYGPNLKFVVFDVRVDEKWLTVPYAHCIAKALELDFVDYARITTKLVHIDAERSKPSVQAVKNGILEPKEREGIVLRPIEESVDSRGNRIITKYKNDAFIETRTKREVDPNRQQILADAVKIADEWVTDMRLEHVMDKAKSLLKLNEATDGVKEFDVTHTGCIIKLMCEDVCREAKGEIVESKDAMRAISTATARLFKKWLQNNLEVKSNG